MSILIADCIMKNLSFRIHESRTLAIAFFRMLGADVKTTYVRPSWADSTDEGVEFPMVQVTLTPQLQSYLHCKSGVDVTGFLYRFGLVRNSRSRRDLARALRRNAQAWDALEPELMPLLHAARGIYQAAI
jgi:hypothetical protein